MVVTAKVGTATRSWQTPLVSEGSTTYRTADSDVMNPPIRMIRLNRGEVRIMTRSARNLARVAGGKVRVAPHKNSSSHARDAELYRHTNTIKPMWASAVRPDRAPTSNSSTWECSQRVGMRI